MATYWTIQHQQAWEEAKRVGYLAGNGQYALDFKEPYQWMIQQMAFRLSCEPVFPVWMWPQRPDMRSSRHLGTKGVKGVLLRIEMDTSRVLLSDFHAWHYVRNDRPVVLYEDEPVEKVESWSRIFDLQTIKASQYYGEGHSYAITPKVDVACLRLDREFICSR